MAFLLSTVTPSSGRVDMVVKRMKRNIRSEMRQVVVRPMNGGNGLHSYTKNSTFQRKAIEAAKELINKAISNELDIDTFSASKTFAVADLGCSVGANTLLAVQNIIDAVEAKFHGDIGPSENLPDFQVFFSDQASNDFNELFVSLPRDRHYFAAGVPGSFHARLFPDNSLHFVHSSCAVQWLSRVPEEVLNELSPASNKGRLHYSSSTLQVIKAFEDQFAEDFDGFLKLRAREIVGGGLMALVLPGRRDGTWHSRAYMNKAFEQVESALMDMANEGKISDGKIDSFNFPIYFTSPQEVESVVRRNGCFKIKAMEIIPHEKVEPRVMSPTLRAGLEGTIKDHFGEEISAELFDLKLDQKFEESSSILDSCESVGLFVLLKRI